MHHLLLIAACPPAAGPALSATLAQLGDEVCVQTLAEDRLEQPLAGAPELILLDAAEPDKTLLARLARFTAHHRLPCILLTETETPQLIHAALSAGVTAYLVEPPSARKLRSVIRVALARHARDNHLHRELHEREQQLSERKRIERAKGLVMQAKQCSEDEAYRLMRQRAMTQQKKLAELADDILFLQGVVD